MAIETGRKVTRAIVFTERSSKCLDEIAEEDAPNGERANASLALRKLVMEEWERRRKAREAQAATRTADLT